MAKLGKGVGADSAQVAKRWHLFSVACSLFGVSQRCDASEAKNTEECNELCLASPGVSTL